MPKYVYYCKHCNGEFEVVHGMMERQEECKICFASSYLRRIPQLTNIKTSQSNVKDNKQTGEAVKQAIAENAEVLKQQKKDATSWEYEPE